MNFPNADGGAAVSLGSTAADVLTEGKFQESFLGFEFAPPAFGARRELAAVRNAQLELARAKAQLEEMELQQSHLLTDAIQNVELTYALVQDQFNRVISLKRQVKDLDLIWSVGQGTDARGRDILNLLLNAQRSLADARSEYYRNICEYNKFVKHIHFLKGSLLQYNSISLSEGPWPEKGYWDALQKARERDASYYLDYGWTRPSVISRGPVDQSNGIPYGAIMESYDGAEVINAVPQPAEPPVLQNTQPTPAPPVDDGPGPITSTQPTDNSLPPVVSADAASRSNGFVWGSLGIGQKPHGDARPDRSVQQASFTTTETAPVTRSAPSGPVGSRPSVTDTLPPMR